MHESTERFYVKLFESDELIDPAIDGNRHHLQRRLLIVGPPGRRASRAARAPANA